MLFLIDPAPDPGGWRPFDVLGTLRKRLRDLAAGGRRSIERARFRRQVRKDLKSARRVVRALERLLQYR